MPYITASTFLVSTLLRRCKRFLPAGILLVMQAYAQPVSAQVTLASDSLFYRIHTNSIDTAEAVKKLEWLASVGFGYIPDPGKVSSKAITCYFPVKGYNSGHVGGKEGNGYHEKGYHFFDGNQHKVHPAHDIFIFDKNQDGLDDRSKQKVQLRAMTEGIIIAVYKNWKPGDPLRSGNYIYLYNIRHHLLLYYAHCENITVQPGQVVKAGDIIGTIGRSGVNAYAKRSPTHLHFSAFHIINGRPVPFNPYSMLKNSIL